MSDTKRWQLIAKLAREKRDESARLLTLAKQELEQHDTRYKQLQAYNAEYSAKLKPGYTSHQDIHSIANMQNFLMKLADVLKQQLDTLKRQQEMYHQALNKFQEDDQYYKFTLEHIEKLKEAKQKVEAKKEQRLLDDHALRTCSKGSNPSQSSA